MDSVPAGSTGFSTRAYSTAESAFSTVVTTLLVTRRGFGWNSLISTNYIIFKNVEIFKIKIKISEKKIWKENKGLDGIFGTLSFVEMNFSKLINYLTNMFQNGPCTRVVPIWQIS